MGGLLWRCLGGSQTWEPDFRWGNKQQEQPTRPGEQSCPSHANVSGGAGDGREGNTGAPMADRDAALFLTN